MTIALNLTPPLSSSKSQFSGYNYRHFREIVFQRPSHVGIVK